MSTQHAGYLGGGALMAVIILVVLQAPLFVWVLAAVGAVAIGVYAAAGIARSRGIDLAHDVLGRTPPASATDGATADDGGPDATEHATEASTLAVPAAGSRDSAAPTDEATVIDVSLVRPADASAGTVDVWLHRHGGRRVHRYEHDGAWVVEQVSTKDPDNPKKRVIGERLTYANVAEAVRAADDLAQGILPEDVDAARSLGVPPETAAEARRRHVRLTGPEQARRLAVEWGMLAGA
jgi:hypothetical protein